MAAHMSLVSVPDLRQQARDALDCDSPEPLVVLSLLHLIRGTISWALELTFEEADSGLADAANEDLARIVKRSKRFEATASRWFMPVSQTWRKVLFANTLRDAIDAALDNPSLAAVYDVLSNVYTLSSEDDVPLYRHASAYLEGELSQIELVRRAYRESLPALTTSPSARSRLNVDVEALEGLTSKWIEGSLAFLEALEQAIERGYASQERPPPICPAPEPPALPEAQPEGTSPRSSRKRKRPPGALHGDGSGSKTSQLFRGRNPSERIEGSRSKEDEGTRWRDDEGPSNEDASARVEERARSKSTRVAAPPDEMDVDEDAQPLEKLEHQSGSLSQRSPAKLAPPPLVQPAPREASRLKARSGGHLIGVIVPPTSSPRASSLNVAQLLQNAARANVTKIKVQQPDEASKVTFDPVKAYQVTVASSAPAPAPAPAPAAPAPLAKPPAAPPTSRRSPSKSDISASSLSRTTSSSTPKSNVVIAAEAVAAAAVAKSAIAIARCAPFLTHRQARSKSPSPEAHRVGNSSGNTAEPGLEPPPPGQRPPASSEPSDGQVVPETETEQPSSLEGDAVPASLSDDDDGDGLERPRGFGEVSAAASSLSGPEDEDDVDEFVRDTREDVLSTS